MLQVSHSDSLTPFSLEDLKEIYQKLNFPQRARIFEFFLPKDSQLPKKNPPYPSSIFPQRTRQFVSVLSSILGYYSDEWVDEPILGFRSTFSSEEGPSVTFDYGHFLANVIHEQFLQFVTEEMFKYSSILMYMFMFFQTDKFTFAVKKIDKKGEPHSIVFWTSLIWRRSQEFNFSDSIDQFLYPTTCLLTSQQVPRISEDIQKILQLSEHIKTGDWYVFQSFTEIRVYGSEFPPYKLPRYLPMRIFSLEYTRKKIHFDNMHFVVAKKKS